VRTNPRDTARRLLRCGPSRIHEGVVVADLRERSATPPFQVLCLQSDGGERKEFVVAPQPRVAVNNHVRMQSAARAQHDVLANDAERPDLTACANLRFRMDHGSRMHMHLGQAGIADR